MYLRLRERSGQRSSVGPTALRVANYPRLTRMSLVNQCALAPRSKALVLRTWTREVSSPTDRDLPPNLSDTNGFFEGRTDHSCFTCHPMGSRTNASSGSPCATRYHGSTKRLTSLVLFEQSSVRKGSYPGGLVQASASLRRSSNR
jgi:hypothetical protein